MLPGGTDHDCGEGHYPAQLLNCEAFTVAVADATFAARAWAQSVSWTVVLGGVGSILTGLAQHDTALLASGVTAVVVAFLPRARPLWVYSVAQTWAMRQGWTAVPASERPLRSADEVVPLRLTPEETFLYRAHGPRCPELPERERGN